MELAALSFESVQDGRDREDQRPFPVREGHSWEMQGRAGPQCRSGITLDGRERDLREASRARRGDVRIVAGRLALGDIAALSARQVARRELRCSFARFGC